MHLDPILPILVAFSLVVLLTALALRALRQPYVIAYLLAGVLLGRHGLGLISDVETIEHLGAIGVMLLLFFVGMEISLPKLVANWRVAIVGTFIQIALSVGIVAAIGWRLGWGMERWVLLGFVISLSSTAVLFKILEEWNELDTPVGRNVVSILLAQDMAVIPMMIVLGWLAGSETSAQDLTLQIVGGVGFLATLGYLLKRGQIRLPFGDFVRGDHELQVFAAMIVCFGLALLTGLAGLSTALGAFLAGIIIGAARETEWVHHSLNSFRVVFLALFFVSIGMLIDLDFLRVNWKLLAGLVAAVLVVNTFINAGILRVLGDEWGQSLYAGALLSQIGEFSFLLGSVGFHAGIIGEYTYQTTIATISLSLLISPMWIGGFKRLTGQGKPI